VPRSAALGLALAAVALASAVALLSAAPADAAGSTKLVAYRGVRLKVPASWPVFRLSHDPSVCVRFNRHAVYLGHPAAVQHCPAVALGRTEAILVSPGSALPGVSDTAALVRKVRGLTLTATWRSRPALVRAALGPLWRVPLARAAQGPTGGAGFGSTGPTGVSGPTGATGPIVTGPSVTYTGLGFDACTDPSPTQLNAWLASPYRAVGLYIGGANMGCSQPSLNAANVSAEISAGWHLVPTYVGLQAPSNSCGCSAISASQAAAQGTAAAVDAVTDAQANGIGSGNPIYYDMEAYPPGKPAITTTVLTFLSAWTTELHALGYQSGVYSSADSGITDLAAAVGSSYAPPDDIWSADWNGQQSTTESVLPAGDWANHQRLHQYEGANDETYGGVKINVDNDYLDGATVGGSSTPPPAPSTPSLTISPQPDGSIDMTGSWTGTTGIAGWRLLGGTNPAGLSALTGTLSSGQIVSHSAFPYFAAQALGSAGQVLGTSPATATPGHLAIYGHSVFVPATGWAGLPVGCFTGSDCRLVVTIAAGRKVLAQTKPERVSNGASGLVYFAVSAAGHRMIAGAAGHRLPVTVSIRDASGATAQASMNLVGFTTTGSIPARTVSQGTMLKVVGLEDFVAGGGFGGILAECVNAMPCQARVTLSAGRTTLAASGSEFMGANELSYLSFRLSPHARSLLAAAGGVMAARLKLAVAGDAATANIALIHF
jgi:hypothetical protein